MPDVRRVNRAIEAMVEAPVRIACAAVIIAAVVAYAVLDIITSALVRLRRTLNPFGLY